MKYLGVKIKKHAQNLYVEKYTALVKKMKETLKGETYLWNVRSNIDQSSPK